MKHVKKFLIIIVYLAIYYAFQIVNVFIIELKALISGMNKNTIVDYVEANTAFILIPAMVVSIFIFFFILKARKKSMLQICKIRKVSFKNIGLIILMVLGYSMALSAITLKVIKYFPSYDTTAKTMEATMTSMIGIIAVLICAPIFEEIMFRGIILNELREDYKIVPSIIIQAVLFGIYHLNLFQGIYAGILGLLLGYIFIKTKTILSSITGHITFNICGTFVFPVLLEFTSKFWIIYFIVGTILMLIAIAAFYRSDKGATAFSN